MGKREYFPAFFSYKRTLKGLSDEQMGRVFRAALEYADTGEEPNLEPLEMMGFAFMKEDIDRANATYNEMCEARKANGSKGGRPKQEEPSGLSENLKNQKVISETKRTYSEGKGEGERKEKNNTSSTEDVKEEPPEFAGVPLAKIRDMYHKLCPSFKPLKGMEGERRRLVAGRWTTYPDLETFETVFRNAEASDFLKGRNDRNWTATFDWLMRPTNFQKVLEGNYENKEPSVGAEDRDPMLAYLDKVINGEIKVGNTFAAGGDNSDFGGDSGHYQGASDSLSELLQPIQSG